MPNGWKKGIRSLSFRQQMGADTFDRCRCSSCMVSYQQERAGVHHCGSSTYTSCTLVDTNRKKRKNSDLLVLYRQRRYTRRNERGYGPCKTREVQRRSYCGHQTIVLLIVRG